MKLILCLACQDVRKLLKEGTTCQCGKSGGHYFEDGIHAEYWGDCVPIGFSNISFGCAVANQPEEGQGEYFDAFVIPKECGTMKKVEMPVFNQIMLGLQDSIDFSKQEQVDQNGKESTMPCTE